jgi:hypothetical protein
MAAGPFESFTVTLTGSAQALATAAQSKRLREIHIQGDPENANGFWIGGPELTADNGIWVPAPVAGDPGPPIIFDGFADGSVAADTIYVLGTNGQTVHVLAVRFTYGQPV